MQEIFGIAYCCTPDICSFGLAEQNLYWSVKVQNEIEKNNKKISQYTMQFMQNCADQNNLDTMFLHY